VPLDTDKYLHERLSALIIELKKLTSKATYRFQNCEIEPSDLYNVADFLRQVAGKISTRKAGEEAGARTNNEEQQEWVRTLGAEKLRAKALVSNTDTQPTKEKTPNER
jgi:hypothetical protein